MMRVNTELMREQILDAVIECKIEASGAEVSLAQIACRANISERTLNRYFPDKEMLLYEGSIRYLKRIYDSSAKIFKTMENPSMNGLEALISLIRIQVDKNEKDVDKAKIFVRAYTTALRTAVYRDLPVTGYDAPVRNLVLKFVEDGVKDGSIRKDAEPMSIYLMLSSNFIGLMQRLIYLYSVEFSKEEHNKIFAVVFHNYIEMVESYLKA